MGPYYYFELRISVAMMPTVVVSSSIGGAHLYFRKIHDVSTALNGLERSRGVWPPIKAVKTIAGFAEVPMVTITTKSIYMLILS